jgi:hypothetical protein
LIAKSLFIGQYPPLQNQALMGSERETAMRGFGKSSAWVVAVFALVSGLALLPPTQASAQFNIEGLIRGAIQQGCCYGGGGYHYRSGSGYSSRHAKSHDNDQDSAPDKSKEKDATQVESPNNGVSGRQQPSGAQNPAPRSVESDAPSKQSSAARGNDDQPAF